MTGAEVLDIGRDELRALVEDAQLDAYQRRLDDVRCEHIMARELVTTTRDTPLPDAWSLFARHRVKALPVVDGGSRLVGIVTQADFLRELDPSRLDARLQLRSAFGPGGRGRGRGVGGCRYHSIDASTFCCCAASRPPAMRRQSVHHSDQFCASGANCTPWSNTCVKSCFTRQSSSG